MFRKTYSLIFLLAILAGAAFAHKFYTSITELSYNKESHSAEVMIHVFANDLEKAVATFHQRKLKIEQPDFDSLAFIYIGNKFLMETSRKELKKISPVGIEYKRDHATIYFEILLPEGFKNLTLTNTLFTELFSQQTNIVTIRSGTKKVSLVFNKETGTRELTL
jgi:hypothetical protein